MLSSLDNVLAVILGGGRGSRLYPLTKQRSKPAVPIAGRFRLIDIPISNCINSGIFRIGILTQFNSVSLHRHITRTYTFDSFHSGWIQVWAAEQTISNVDWYQGTADAVRKQLVEIRSSSLPYVLILAGDHLYRMDYNAMFQFHRDNKADITVAVQPIATHDTGRFGILKRDSSNKLIDFAEKPTNPDILERMVSRDDEKRPFLGSMGIYLFNVQVLIDLLEDTKLDDFGGHVLPQAIHSHQVFGYDFDDYWEDIGTIRSFYDTNIALTVPDAPFSFFDPVRPIYTNPNFLPCSIVENSKLKNVMLAEGCLIQGSKIRSSVIGLRSRIGNNSNIKNSILMGNDYYQRKYGHGDESPSPFGIDRDCNIQGAIIDKNTILGESITIKPFPPGTDLDFENWVVRDGIVVIPKGTILPPGTYIGP